MSFAIIKDYNMAVELPTCGLRDKVKDEILYEVVWDGPVHDPNEPELWERSKKSLVGCINTYRKEGIVPIVAVFVPRK